MIQVTLRQLEYFAAAVRHGGAARGAEALNVSQPSISKAIADLEALWGERLFVRQHAQGLEPTPAGVRRFRQASVLLQQAAALSGQGTRGLEGALTLGCLSTLAPRHVPAILSRFAQDHPQITVRLQEGDTEALIRQLERGSIDMALMYDLGLARSVRVEPVADLWPYALLPWGHRLATHSTIRLTELAREPLVLINLPHSRAYFLSLFRMAGATPNIVAESASLEMVRAMVANGLGVSVLTTRPARDVAYDGKRLACRRLRGNVIAQSVALVYPAGEGAADHLCKAMAGTVRAHFAKLE